jgi:hypothetical protein
VLLLCFCLLPLSRLIIFILPFLSLVGTHTHTLFSCSFMKDVHMVVDASIVVDSQATADLQAGNAANRRTESLWPARHRITLPINSLNMMFSACDVAINNHVQVTADR